MILDAAQIAYNGLTIPSDLTLTPGGVPSSGYLIEQVDVSPIAIDQFVERRALQDGINAADVYEGQRSINIAASVFGSSEADFADKIEAWMWAFNPVVAELNDGTDLTWETRLQNIGFLPFDFDRFTTDTTDYPSGKIPLRFFARPFQPPTMVEDRNAQGGKYDKGLRVRVTAHLITREPFAISQALHSADITVDSSAITVKGNFPTNVIVQVHLSSASFSTGIGGVWLANSDLLDIFPAANIASKQGYPLLYTQYASVPDETLAELDKLHAGTIYLAGGTTLSISSNVETFLTDRYPDATITRVGDGDQYQVAANIATHFWTSAPSEVWIFTGEDAHPGDGVSSLMGSGKKAVPILMSQNTIVNSSLTAALSTLAPLAIYIAGSTLQINASVASTIGTFTVGTTTRLGGATRFDTNQLISQHVYTGALDNVIIIGADASSKLSTDGIDGAVAGSFAAGVPAAILLVTYSSLPSQAKSEIDRLGPSHFTIIGGTSVVSAAVANLLAQYTTNAIKRYAGADRYATAVLAADDHLVAFAGVGGCVRISNWNTDATWAGLGDGPFTLLSLEFQADSTEQIYIYNPVEDILFNPNHGYQTTYLNYITAQADMVPPGTGGSNASGSFRDGMVDIITAFWRDRWVF